MVGMLVDEPIACGIVYRNGNGKVVVSDCAAHKLVRARSSFPSRQMQPQQPQWSLAYMYMQSSPSYMYIWTPLAPIISRHTVIHFILLLRPDEQIQPTRPRLRLLP